MPNLVRAPSMPSVPIPTSSSAAASSSSLLHNSQSFDSSSGLARLQSSSKTPAPPILCRSVTNRSVFRFLLRLSPLSRPASEPGPEPRELLLAITATTESHRLRQPDGQGPDVRQPHVSERQRHPSAQQTSRRRLRPRRSATPRLHPGPHKLQPPRQGGFIITKVMEPERWCSLKHGQMQFEQIMMESDYHSVIITIITITDYCHLKRTRPPE